MPTLPSRGQVDWDDEMAAAFAALESTDASIQASANSAVSTANSAANTANAASATASAAAAQVTTALTNAAAAQATANSASTTAAAAQTTATQAETLPSFWPHKYGANGGGSTDDTVAVQAAIDAAAANGGGVVNMWGPLGARTYLISGPVYVKDGVSLMGFGGSEIVDDTKGSRIVCTGSAGAVYFGRWTGGTFRPGFLMNLVIDGNGAGDPNGILRLQCISASIINVTVRDGAGHGIVFDHTQNTTLFAVRSCSHAAGAAVLMDQGAGGNLWVGGHIFDSQYGVKFLHDAGAAQGYMFCHSNEWQHVVLETYTADRTFSLVETQSGYHNKFTSCVFSGQIDAMLDGTLVKIITDASFQPQLELNSCWFAGYSVGRPDYGIDITGTSVAIVAVTGMCTFQNLAAAFRTASGSYSLVFDYGHRYVGGVPVGVVTGVGTFTNFNIKGAPAQVTRYTTAQADTEYVIPIGTKRIRVRGGGGGGQGGSGRRGAAASVRCGGGGGQGGGCFDYELLVTDIYNYSNGGKLFVTVGAGGSGLGNAQTADSTNGVAGATGGDTKIGYTTAATIANTIALGQGGQGGFAGTVSTGAGGGTADDTKGQSTVRGGSGGTASTTGGAGAQSATMTSAGPGGGAGGGITSGNVDAAGGSGAWPVGRQGSVSANGGTAAGGAGEAGTNSSLFTGPGNAGSGGGGNAAGAGGAGGAGGRCAGGGGGGASANGSNSGAGGIGGVGFVEITAIFN
jgi:hypothetical protein